MNSPLSEVRVVRSPKPNDEWTPFVRGDVVVGENFVLTHADENAGIKSTLWRHFPSPALRYKREVAEYMYILEGTAVITEEASGQAWTVRGGDMFYVPAGFLGTWKTLDKIVKFAVNV